MAENVGGFFASLSLQSDKNSFSQGIASLKDVAGGLANLLKAGLGLGAAAAGTAAYLATIVNAQAKIPVSAAGVKMSAVEFASLSASMGIAGYSADDLMGSLKTLNDQIEGLRQGDPAFEATATKFGMLSGDFKKLQSEGGVQRLIDVMNAADSYAQKPGNTQQGAALLVEKILGGAGRNFYTWLSGTSLDQILGMGRSATLMTGADFTKAMAFSEQLGRLTQDLKGALNLFATDVLSQFTPDLKALGDYVVAHRAEITATIKEWASNFGDFLKNLGPVANAMLKVLDAAGKMSKWLGKAEGTAADFAGGGVATLKNNLILERQTNIEQMIMSGQNVSMLPKADVSAARAQIRLELSREAQRLLSFDPALAESANSFFRGVTNSSVVVQQGTGK